MSAVAVGDRAETVRLELPSCEPTTGQATFIERAPPTRMMRAAIVWGGCWVAAFVCVFIPLLHFILVPGFLIAGVLLGVSRLREDVTLATIEGACPRCKAQRTFVVGGRFTEGRTVHCDGCGNAFSVHLKPALPPASTASAPT